MFTQHADLPSGPGITQTSCTGDGTECGRGGGFFLLQHVDLAQFGQQVTGLEMIGNLRPFDEPASADVHSRFYDSAGNTFDYVYELTGDKLTIWAGAKGSPAYYEGTFTAMATRSPATGSVPARRLPLHLDPQGSTMTSRNGRH